MEKLIGICEISEGNEWSPLTYLGKSEKGTPTFLA